MASTTSDGSQSESDAVLATWAHERDFDLHDLNDGQPWVVCAALRFLAYAGSVTPLRRLVAYMLSHCGMDLSALAVAVGQTARGVRKGRQFTPSQFWRRVQEARRGHPRPKLESADVGEVAKFLAEHRKCKVAELLAFIQTKFGVEMDRLTLRRFLKWYGLGCLREGFVSDAPFLSAELFTAALLYRHAVACFGGLRSHWGGRLVLSLFFKAALGLQRIFHFDSINDLGFAHLTGGKRLALSRTVLGHLVRVVSTRAD